MDPSSLGSTRLFAMQEALKKKSADLDENFQENLLGSKLNFFHHDPDPGTALTSVHLRPKHNPNSLHFLPATGSCLPKVQAPM